MIDQLSISGESVHRLPVLNEMIAVLSGLDDESLRHMRNAIQRDTLRGTNPWCVSFDLTGRDFYAAREKTTAYSFKTPSDKYDL